MWSTEQLQEHIRGATIQAIVVVAAFFVLGYVVYRALTMSLDRVIDARFHILRVAVWSPAFFLVLYLAFRLTDQPLPDPVCRVLSDVPYLNCDDPTFKNSPVMVMVLCAFISVVSVHYGKLQTDLFIVARECVLAVTGFALVIACCAGLVRVLQNPELFK